MQKPKTFYQPILNILAISVVLGLVLTYFTCPVCQVSGKSYAIVSGFSVAMWFFLWFGNDSMAHWLDLRISWIEHPARRLVVGVLAMVVYSASVAALLLVIWQRVFKFYLGDFNLIVISSLAVTVFISLVMHSRAFLLCWKQSQIDTEKFKRESVAAQYESLKNQVNPHFLFNSLNALTSLVYEDPDKAAKFIKQLSEVYRYVLETREKEVVPLAEELKFLDAYIFLQEIRFGDNLNIQRELSNARGLVAPLALQLLLENAIKHNIVSSGNPLHIRLSISENYLVVENNLQRKSAPDDHTSGLGLENIRRRYGFLTNLPVQIIENDNSFVVRLPLIPTHEGADY